jgi:hypothetical protein
MTAEDDVRAKVRRLWLRYAAALWVETGAAIAVFVWMAVQHWRSAHSYVLGGLVVGLLALFTYAFAEINALRPHVWFGSAVRFGFLSWFAGMAALTSDRPEPPETAGFLASLGVLCVASWIPAARAKGRAVAEVGDTELMEANLEASFFGRDNDVVLNVDNEKVFLSMTVRLRRFRDEETGTWSVRRGGVDHTFAGCALRDIENLRTTYLRTGVTWPLPGREPYVLRLTTGPALVFDSPQGKWIIPINRADKAYDLIEDKIKKFGQPDLSGDFLPKET